MFLVGMAGVLIGDGVVFTAGRFLGQRAFSLPLIRRLMTPERYARVQGKFAQHGSWVVFAARFYAGTPHSHFSDPPEQPGRSVSCGFSCWTV